jgi:hypothetical protein
MMRTNLGVAMLASGALLVAGCGGGGSSSPSVAHLSSSPSGGSSTNGAGQSSSPESSAPTRQKLVAFSQCMRTLGVPEFPEPNSEGDLQLSSGDHNGHVTGINPQSSRFQAAQKACAKLAPNGGKPPSPAQQAKAQESALKFSQCMRTHGVPDFPDPEFHSGGGIGIRIGGKKGNPGAIEPNSPQFKSAQKTCQPLMIGPGGKGGPLPAPTGGGGPEQSSSSEETAP